MFALAASGDLDVATPAANASGLKYSPEEMRRRILEIAENSIPTRAELEREFGVKFLLRDLSGGNDGSLKYYYATAQSPPFATPAPPLFANMVFIESEASILLVFEFNPRRLGVPSNDYCVGSDQVFDYLEKRWGAVVNDRGGHYPVEIKYKKNINGVERNVSTYPSRIGSASCIGQLLINFNTIKEK